MEKYKLIKEYPGSPKIGYISCPKVDRDVEYTDNHYYSGSWFDPSNFPEFWEKVVPQDFEILSFKHDGSHGVPIGYTIKMKDGMIDSPNQKLDVSHYLNSSCWKINSVKRLSDGEIFTIGDLLDGFDVTARISLFRIENNQMKVGVRECGVVTLNACKHKKSPIAISEDGVKLFVGDIFFGLNITNWYRGCKSTISKQCDYTNARKYGFRWFSSEEAVNNYILKNKPVWTDEDMKSFGGFARGAGNTPVTSDVFDWWKASSYNKKKDDQR